MAGKIVSVMGSAERLETKIRDHTEKTRKALSEVYVPLAVGWLLPQGS